MVHGALVEREKELKELSGLLTACAAGQGSIVIVSGPLKCGKTALLQEFAERAGAAGAIFLEAPGSESGPGLALEILGQLLACSMVPACIRQRAERLLRACAVDGPAGEPRSGAAADLPVRCVYEAVRILLELSKQCSLLIAVDDIQRAGVSSLTFLRYLARALKSASVMMVLSEYVGARHAYAQFHAELLRMPYCRIIELRLLSERGVAQMLAAQAPGLDAPGLAAACHQMTGGNPMLARALIDDYAAQDGVPGQVIPGAAFSHAMSAFLYRCEPVTAAVAGALAVLGAQSSPATLAEVTGLSSESVTLAVEVLSAGGLLEAGQLRHDAIRRAVLRSLDIKDREALHGRAASVLYDHGADATAVACHLVAEPDGVAPWAVFILQDAAEEALVGDDVNLAIRYLRTAYQVCANEQQRMAIRTRLIYAEWRVNPAVALRDLPLLAAAALDHRLELRDAVELIGYLLWFGLEGQAVDVLAAIERRCADRSELEPEIEERLQLAQIWLGCMHNHLPTQLNMPSEKGCSWIRSTPLRAVKLLRKIVAGEGDDEVLSEAEKILQGARLDTETVMPFTVAIASLAYVKELDKAADWSDSLLREAAGRSAPMWEAWFSAICATISFHRGRLTEADDFAKRAFDLASPKSWGVTVGLPIACLLLAMTAMNRYEEAAAYAEIPVPDAMFQTVWGPYYLHARGRYYLATGRYHAALDDFENCREMMSAWNFDLPALVPWRVDIALAWSGLGQFRQARELMRNQLARLRSSDLHLRGICLRTLATASDLHERPAPLREAASLLERCGDLFELCLTIAELSRTYQALGHESLARVLARRARRLARACGADPCDVLGSSVPPGWTKAEAQDSTTSSPVAKLSEAELRVAALAAQGYTNREVADRLFITVSTVEQHLTRVYRKLVVRRRSDLPIELLRANGAPQATPP